MELTCAFCSKKTEKNKTGPAKKFCSKKCAMKDWRSKNKKYMEDYRKIYREKNKEKIIEYTNNPKVKKKRNLWKKEYRKRAYVRKKEKEYDLKYRKKPDRKKKYNVRDEARRKIPIPKGQICQEKGCRRLAVERHHPNYDTPLEVEFVCKRCHGKIN